MICLSVTKPIISQIFDFVCFTETWLDDLSIALNDEALIEAAGAVEVLLYMSNKNLFGLQS